MPDREVAPLDGRLRRAYDLAAEGYEAHRYASTEAQFYRRAADAMLKLMVEPEPGLTVLDMPCGTGRMSIPLAQAGATVAGVDISERMLEKARANTPESVKDHFTLRAASGRSLPFDDDTFDVVTSFKFFHLIDDDQKRLFLDEMLRVTKPGGRLLLEFNSPFYGVALSCLRYARKGNLHRIRTKCLFPDQNRTLFLGLQIRRVAGVKLPLSGLLSRVFGFNVVFAINRIGSTIPVLRQLYYALIVEIQKSEPRSD